MDLQTLSNLFATTYNANPNVRIAAELQIRKARLLIYSHMWHSFSTLFFYFVQIGNEEGMIAALLRIIAAENIDQYVPNTRLLPA